MKLILIILCGLAILFAGGCLVVLGSEGGSTGFEPFVFAVLAFNAVFIWAAKSAEKWAGPVLMAFGIVDIVICGVLVNAFGDPYVGPLAVVGFGLFALKALAAEVLGYRKYKASRGG